MATLRSVLLTAAVFLVACGIVQGLPASVHAGSAYPERDITVVVPFKPGGGTDVIARAAGPYFKKYLPKPVNLVVQNIDAAGGRVGTFRVYDAKPDGYTIGLMEPYTFVVAEVLGETSDRTATKMRWLPLISTSPFMVTMSSQSPIKSLQDIKGKRLRASAAQATLPTSVAILRALGGDPQIVMYGGGAECSLAAIRGDVDSYVGIAPTAIRAAASAPGKLVLLAVLANERVPEAPQVPTIKEAGFDIPKDVMALAGYDYIFAAPPGLPDEIAQILSETIQKMAADKEFVSELAKAKIPVSYAPGPTMQETVSQMPRVLAGHKEAIKRALGK
jgi:tripartite-type tricarboxylate transporter receptor subunit TctC